MGGVVYGGKLNFRRRSCEKDNANDNTKVFGVSENILAVSEN